VILNTFETVTIQDLKIQRNAKDFRESRDDAGITDPQARSLRRGG
jgi:hypothetical protein